MAAEPFGVEGIDERDREYGGSRFSEVRQALFANRYQNIWGKDGEKPLPIYEVTLASVLRGVLSFTGRYRFLQAAERTVGSGADLRWGTNVEGFRRLVRPQWGLSHRTLADHRNDGLFRLFPSGQRSLGDRSLPNLLYGDPSRPLPLVGACRQALPNNRSAACRAAPVEYIRAIVVVGAGGVEKFFTQFDKYEDDIIRPPQ
jgi:hypothetical protein